MSDDVRKLYWDSSCFICFLNRDEVARRTICEDILRNALGGVVEIWTSTCTIAEVIRPRRHGSAPLPLWATKAIEAVEKSFPQARRELEQLWQRYQSSDPATKLTPDQIAKIQKMFQWPYIKKINLDERVANKAVELARDYGLKPADSVHAASAILRKVSALQKWDRDFDKVAHLITVEEPRPISPQPTLFDSGLIAAGPTPDDFEETKKEATAPPVSTETAPAEKPSESGPDGDGR